MKYLASLITDALIHQGIVDKNKKAHYKTVLPQFVQTVQKRVPM